MQKHFSSDMDFSRRSELRGFFWSYGAEILKGTQNGEKQGAQIEENIICNGKCHLK